MAGLFLAGDWLFQQSSQLPQAALVALTGVSILAAALRLGLRWWLWLPLGWVWAAICALLYQPPEIPVDWPGRTVAVRMTVADLPALRADSARFVAVIRAGDADTSQTWRVRLWWRDPPPLRVGQVWQVGIRLKPAHAYRNPGSWDYAAWLYRQGIRYTGYVAPGEPRLLAEDACCRLARSRQAIRDRLQAVDAPPAGKALLQALVIGDRSGITQAMRDVAAVTGVSHLLAISGLHIGLVGGLLGFLSAWGWRRTAWCGRVPAALAGALAGLGAAAVYALLSGLGLPARRALLMLAGAGALLWLRRGWEPWQVYGQVLLIVLLLQPLAVLDAGFWLSFVAVAAILALLPQLQGRPWWQVWIALQLGISLALYPVLIAFDMPTSPLGLPVNLLLVPLFSLLLIPAALIATLLSLLPGHPVLPLAWLGEALAWVWQGLEWAAVRTADLDRPAWSPAMLAGLCLGIWLLLAPTGIRSRAAGAVLLLACHLPPDKALPEGAFRLDVLDVGQGLSAVIRTRRHVLIYDTGAAYPGGFNLADSVLLPWLRHEGIGHADILVLSHGDNDHAGAAPRLHARFPTGRVISGEPGRVAVAASLCASRYYWRWDGVLFGFIQPPEASGYRGNNASCVLLVSAGAGRALLTGDAEQRIERILAPGLRREAPVDVVVAGHHGSSTSSSAAFVHAVRATHVIYSAGYRNRYGFPKVEVDSRWREAGSRRWRTDGCGALSLVLGAAAPVDSREVSAYASHHRHYWEPADTPCEMTGPAASSMIHRSASH